MARTDRSIILGILRKYEDFVSPGELFREAEEDGYEGTQERLLTRADTMITDNVIIGNGRGMAQNLWYKRRVE